MATTPRITTKQVSQALDAFYQQPVARVSLELILTILMVIFLAVFAIRPTLVTMSDLIKEIEDKQKLSDDLSKKIAALSTTQVEYAAAEPKLVFLNEAIPSTPDLLTTLKIIEKLAEENKVIINTASINEVPPEVSEENAINDKTLVRKNLSASLSLTGDYVSIRSYVQALMNTRRSIIVDTITFSVQDTRDQKSLVATLTVNIPYYGEPNNEEK